MSYCKIGMMKMQIAATNVKLLQKDVTKLILWVDEGFTEINTNEVDWAIKFKSKVT